MSLSTLLAELRIGKCIVTYKKIDSGEIRHMECTLNPALIPNNYDIPQDPSSSDFVVWCTDKDAWRSFRVSTMVEWKVKQD